MYSEKREMRQGKSRSQCILPTILSTYARAWQPVILLLSIC